VENSYVGAAILVFALLFLVNSMIAQDKMSADKLLDMLAGVSGVRFFAAVLFWKSF
jgi:hypothetical protein